MATMTWESQIVQFAPTNVQLVFLLQPTVLHVLQPAQAHPVVAAQLDITRLEQRPVPPVIILALHATQELQQIVYLVTQPTNATFPEPHAYVTLLTMITAAVALAKPAI